MNLGKNLVNLKKNLMTNLSYGPCVGVFILEYTTTTTNNNKHICKAS